MPQRSGPASLTATRPAREDLESSAVSAWHFHCRELLLRATSSREGAMLWTIAVILLVLWALGLGTSYTAGGLVHLLLVIALLVIVFQFIAGRRSI
jgi:Family of unknown function (DUF5670)